MSQGKQSDTDTHLIGKIEVTNTKSGETRTFIGLKGQQFSSYAWTEGNNGCDCNRVLCFEQAAGFDGDFDYPCHHGEPVYRVRIFNEDGALLFDDTENSEEPYVIAGHDPFA